MNWTPRVSAPLRRTSATVALLASGCTTPKIEPKPAEAESYWKGDEMTGSPSVRINLSKQRAYFYKGGELAGVSILSSGREGYDTVTGSFRITEKDEEHASSLYGTYVHASGSVIQENVDTRKHPRPPGARYKGADMPYWMRITGGTGMHAGYLPGYPASHGCIRLPLPMAEAFFRSIKVGTPVQIEP